MGIFFTDNSFSEMQFNPFNHGRRYNHEWIMLKLLDSASFLQYTGGGKNGIFQLVITKKNVDWEYRIFDFIQYETECDHNIILAVNQEDYDTAKKTYGNHSHTDRFLRFYEKKVLVHTTTKESYCSIKLDGCLKSWNLLKQEKELNEDVPIGALLGDPLDYSNYIMFSNGSYSTEIIISSKQKRYIEMDADKPYIAGARLYFDCEKIAKDGLLIRDGAHLKVKQCLPLEKYLLWTATPAELGISEETTPRIFGEKADSMFEEIFKINL